MLSMRKVRLQGMLILSLRRIIHILKNVKFRKSMIYMWFLRHVNKELESCFIYIKSLNDLTEIAIRRKTK